VDIKSRWRHNWKSAQVVNSHSVCDPTIRQPGFNLPWQQWSLLNLFRTEQGHCSACRRKWQLTDTDLCPCGETQTMSQIVESCPLTKLNGGLSRLHCADEDAVSWLTSYGSWHAYEKKCHRIADVVGSSPIDNHVHQDAKFVFYPLMDWKPVKRMLQWCHMIIVCMLNVICM